MKIIIDCYKLERILKKFICFDSLSKECLNLAYFQIFKKLKNGKVSSQIIKEYLPSRINLLSLCAKLLRVHNRS